MRTDIHRSAKIRSRNLRKSLARGAGFTLVEVIIFSGFLVILLAVLSNVFVSILDVRTQSEATSAVSQDGRYIISRLTYDIGRATAISAPASPGLSGASLVLTIGGAQYTYTLNGQNLTLTTGGNVDSLNSYATQISDLAFTRIGNVGGKNTIRATFRVTSAIQTTPTEYQDFQMTGGTR